MGDFIADMIVIESNATYTLDCGGRYAVVMFLNISAGTHDSFGIVCKAADGVTMLHTVSDGKMTVTSDDNPHNINFKNTSSTRNTYVFRVFFIRE